MTTEHVRSTIRDFILKNFVFEENAHLGDDQSLVKSGVIDSTGVLELIAFAENEFHVHFEDDELVAENFDTISRVTACITRKLTPNTPREKENGE